MAAACITALYKDKGLYSRGDSSEYNFPGMKNVNKTAWNNIFNYVILVL